MISTPEDNYLHKLIESYVAPLRGEIKALRKALTEQQALNTPVVMLELPDNHVCRYSKSMNQPYPRLCVDCGKPENN